MIVAFGCSFTFGDELDDLPKWYEDFDDKRNFMPEKEKYHKFLWLLMRPPKCSECKDVYLTNPDSKKDGVCRECKGKVGMGKMAKGFKYN